MLPACRILFPNKTTNTSFDFTQESVLEERVKAVFHFNRMLKAVFHSIISPPPAKYFEIEIIFYVHASLKILVLPVQSLKIFKEPAPKNN